MTLLTLHLPDFQQAKAENDALKSTIVAQAEEIRMLKMQMGSGSESNMMFGMPSAQQLMQMQQMFQQQMFQQMLAASSASQPATSPKTA